MSFQRGGAFGFYVVEHASSRWFGTPPTVTFFMQHADYYVQNGGTREGACGCEATPGGIIDHRISCQCEGWRGGDERTREWSGRRKWDTAAELPSDFPPLSLSLFSFALALFL